MPADDEQHYSSADIVCWLPGFICCTGVQQGFTEEAAFTWVCADVHSTPPQQLELRTARAHGKRMSSPPDEMLSCLQLHIVAILHSCVAKCQTHPMQPSISLTSHPHLPTTAACPCAAVPHVIALVLTKSRTCPCIKLADGHSALCAGAHGNTARLATKPPSITVLCKLSLIVRLTTSSTMTDHCLLVDFDTAPAENTPQQAGHC